MDGLKTKLVDAFGLGIGFWLMGYVASLILYFAIPLSILGWVLFVICTPITSCVAYLRFRKRREDIKYYLMVAAVWAAMAIALDYIFIVIAFNSQDYYKLDVFVYYATTFAIPLLIGQAYGRKRG